MRHHRHGRCASCLSIRRCWLDCQGSRRRVQLTPVTSEHRAPILREYVRIAQSGRQHFPLPVAAPLAEFSAIAEHYPVYRMDFV
jgi:hypothetical protein